MIRQVSLGLLCGLVAAVACDAQPNSLTVDRAREVFGEAAALSAQDGGRHWGVELYGPILLVDRTSRRAFANTGAGDLLPSGDVYSGVLPDSVGLANTATTWAGIEWTMLLWPLPEDPFDRRSLLAHEMWHRVQDELGFPSADPPNLHLGSRDGRVWLQLEWRALAAALSERGREKHRHLHNALAFRSRRLQIFPDAAEQERQLILHEGLAQYTGYSLSGRTPEDNRIRAVREIESMSEMPTFVRSFAYPTGAAYGLLLDEVDPDWRSGLTSAHDLARLAAGAIGFASPDSLEDVVRETLTQYDGEQLIASEDALEAEREARLASYYERFVDGPALDLPFQRMSVQFDPGTVDALDDLGKVYPSMRLTDVWGVLTVDGGALIAADWSKVVVPAPLRQDTTGLAGEGYVLELNEGWSVTAGPRRGDRVVWKLPPFTPREVSFRSRDGVTIFGDLYLAHEPTDPLILLFHQGASNARAEYLPISSRLLDAGFNLLAIDQRRGGDRFGGVNRTVAGTGDTDYTYCDCYADLEAALDFVQNELRPERIIAWGSSYSAALVFRLGLEREDDIDRILAFSLASGEPMQGCMPELWAAEIDVPVLVLRPAREMELDFVADQAKVLAGMGHAVHVAEPGVHGSSMLNGYRVNGDIESTWNVVLVFLSPDR